MIIKKGKIAFCVNRTKDCFEHLRPFIGKKLSIKQKGKELSVCTKYSRRILLTSNKEVEREIHLKKKECDFRLREHIGHNLRCVAYGSGSIQNISIECEDCCTVLYDVDAI